MRSLRRPSLSFLFVLSLLAMLSPLALACGDDDHGTDGGLGDGALPDGALADGAMVDSGVPPGCAPPPQTAPTITTCPGDTLTPPAGGNCDVTPGSAALLITGDVLTPGEVFRGGQVLVDAMGTIACVGCDCSGEAAAAGATAVVCPDSVVSPGLINPHDHITFIQNLPYDDSGERYEHRHDWRRGIRGHNDISSGGSANGQEMSWGELRFVMGGATSINGSGSTDGFLRNLDRAAQEGLGQPQVDYQTFPLSDATPSLMTGSCAYDPDRISAADIASDDAFTPHVSEGIDAESRNELLCQREGEYDLVQPQSAFIHGIGLLPSDIGELAADGTSLIWSPRSNITLYGETARVTEYAALGVPIALGTDWVITGSMNVLRELRCADELNDQYYAGYFSDEELWLMSTRNAAEVLAVDDVLGTLAVGKVADIAIFSTRAGADHRAILEAEAQDVVLVLRGGKALYGDGAVVQAIEAGCDTIDVCGAEKRACVMREVGSTLAALTSANGSSYPLFFCTDPANEPSCVPERNADAPLPSPEINGSNRYDGQPTMDDTDGDGIPNAMDNCICTFNPIRPLDDGAQADFDADGTGDACDPCPLTAGLSGCAPPDPNDRDGDGLTNDMDNCPNDPNPLQEDRDSDGVGDICDPCPDAPNPGGAACPTTIYDIKDGTIAAGAAVAITDSIVTAVGANGFFMQVNPASPDYTDANYSGVFVYTGTAPTVAVGARIDLTRATVSDFFGETQLTESVIAPMGMATVPAPVDVTPMEATMTRSEALEGVLIRVMEVMVTDTMPPPGAADTAPTNEFVVDGALRVDDLLFLIAPPPSMGETIAEITGPLAFRNGFFKIHPRSATDVLFGEAQLQGLFPALSFARLGGPAATIPDPLTVRLTRAAAGATTVTLTSSGSGLAVMNVVIPPGSREAVVPVEAFTATSTPYTITAELTGMMATADVRVLALSDTPSLVSLTPMMTSASTGALVTMTVTLDLPADAAGTVVTLGVTGGGSAPPTVRVPADRLTADFSFTTPAIAGTSIITATLGAATRMATVDVAMGGPLIISEYVEGASNNKALELYSATGIDLSTCQLRRYTNGSATVSAMLALTGTLAPGETWVLCNGAISDTSFCDVTSSTINHNGNDAYDLFCGGAVVDTFGRIGEDPGVAWTGGAASTMDQTLRRKCSVTTGDEDGADAFDPSVEYDNFARDDFSGLGVRGC